MNWYKPNLRLKQIIINPTHSVNTDWFMQLSKKNEHHTKKILWLGLIDGQLLRGPDEGLQ